MKKQKQSKIKSDALKSFLESTAAPTSQITQVQQPRSQVKAEEFQQYVQQYSNCNVCGIELDKTKIRKCQFCSMPACPQHLRKKRKKKGKWQRICDNCQDKVIYDFYMKLQMKAQQALAVQQQITFMKYDNFNKEAQQRRQKRNQIAFKTMQIKQKYQKRLDQIVDQQNRLMSIQHKVESQQLQIEQLQTFISRAQASFKVNCQDDFNILSEENIKMAKELVKNQKKCLEIRVSIQKKQKQIEQAFDNWQRRQFKKKLEEGQMVGPKKKEKCQIY